MSANPFSRSLAPRGVAETCFELLHMEIVESVRRQTEVKYQCIDCPSLGDAGALLYAAATAPTAPPPGHRPGKPVKPDPTKLAQAQALAAAIAAAQSTLTAEEKAREQRERRDKMEREVNAKLDEIGFQIGIRLAERYTKEQPYLAEQLDIVKFLCKEFWLGVFRKQIDKLQTNYKGVYVLHDYAFRWIGRVDSATAPAATATTGAAAAHGSVAGGATSAAAAAVQLPASVSDAARVYASLACGVVRGALHSLGVTASVKAEVKVPGCTFTIIDQKQTKKTKTQTRVRVRVRVRGGVCTGVSACARGRVGTAHNSVRRASA